MKTSERLFLVCLCCILAFGLLMPTPFSSADDRREGGKHFQKHDGKQRGWNSDNIFGRKRDKGNEATGQVVAWSLAAANLTVLISLSIRAIRRFAPISREVKNSLWKLNSLQKKHLMRFHFLMNPLILAIALLHWSLSRCASTSLPEWGLIIMSIIVGLGILLKFKLCPKTLLRRVYSVHTHPVLALIFVSMLVIGHLAFD